jgi:hypothetical protein
MRTGVLIKLKRREQNMTRILRSIPILLGLFLFCVCVADVHSAVLFQDDFESYDLNSFPSSGGSPCVAPPSGLVSWWSGDGHPFDLIGANNGTITNGATYADGKVGKSFSFDGVDDYVFVPNTASIDGGAQATYAAWVYPAAAPAVDTYTCLVGAGDSTQPVWTTQQCRLLYWRTAGSPSDAAKFYIDCGTNDTEPSYVGRLSANDYSTGTWHLVTGVFNNGSLDIYVNGVLDNGDVTGMNPGTFINTSANNFVWIGALVRSNQTAAFQYFNGLIDEVQILNRALTAQEIVTIYNAGSEGMCKPCSEPPSGLVAWWTGDGNANDLIGANDGTLQNGATLTGGIIGQAFNFDGVDDYVSLPAAVSNLVADSEGTLSAWVYPTSVGDNDIVVAFGSGNDGQGIGLGVWNVVRIYHHTSGYDWHSTTPVSANEWTLLTYTWDTTTERIYKNGVFSESRPRNFSYVPGNGRIGHGFWGDPANAFPGRIDEVSVFSRPLSAEEIAAIYEAGSAGMCSPCVASPSDIVSWWTGDGDADDSVGTNHGTLVNEATFAEGMVGQAFSLDGVDDYVQAASPSDLPLGSEARSMMLWFKTSRDLSSSTESALVQYGTANYNEMFALITSGNAPGKLYFYGHGSDLAGSTTVQPDTWYHGAVTYDGATVRLYVNGLQENEGSMPGLYTALDANGLTIGNRPGSSLWQGELDEVAIFNRALSAEEIAAIYEARSAGMCMPPPIPTYTITGSVNGGHGTITCTSPVNQGDSSTCTITPDEDYHLATLTDNAISVIGSVSNGQYVISNVAANHEVIGTFSIDTFPLSVTLSGTGTGTVTSTPAGIDCGSTCDALFDNETLVTLTATPAIGSFFAGWSGDCNTDGEVTMTAARSCTATFTAYTALQVQTPNGGEDLMAGQSYTIRWGAPAAMETFDVQYSLDGGQTWKKEAIKTAGNSYSWTLPVPSGTANKKKCLVRVIGYSQNVKVASDVSDTSFVINLVRLDSHNGGQPLDAGETVSVQWTRRAGLAATTAKIYYSLNKGVTWVYSGQAAADAGSYNWEVPLTKKPKATCRLKVTLFNGATVVGSDKSDANFTIRTVEVVDPNGGETPTGGQSYDVSYHVYNRYPYARAEAYLSLDGGVTWKLLGQQDPVVAPGPAILPITLPDVATTKKNCKVKVQLVDEDEKVLTNDISDAVFTIGKP